MKTITVRADSEFDALLTRLARRTKTTRSGVIRLAVQSYHRQLERDALRERVRDASFKTRTQFARIADDFGAADADGL